MKKSAIENLDGLVEIGFDSDSQAKTSNTLGSIQVLRGIAALMVGFAHLHSVENKLGGPIIFGNYFLNGFAGVDLFFLISGFVMVYGHPEGFTNFSQTIKFWLQRIFRIYPLWILVCGAIYVLYLYRPDWVYASHNSHPNILKSFLLIPQSEPPLHAVGWTLIHELWFYLVFGILLLFPRKYLLILLCVWGFIINVFLNTQSQSPFILLITHPLSLEFIAGGLCAAAAQRMPIKYAIIFLIMAICGLLMSFYIIGPNANAIFERRFDRVLLFTIPFAILIIAFVNLELKDFKFPGFLRKIGDWSYSFYLLHVPVFALVGRIAAPYSNPNSMIDNLLFAAVAMVAVIVASAISYTIIERPFMKGARKLFSN